MLLKWCILLDIYIYILKLLLSFILLASGGWTETELPFVKKMSALLEYYKQLAHQDKMEKARQKITKRRTNMYLMVGLNPF